MSISGNRKIIVSFKAQQISGAPMVGGYMLQFSVMSLMPAWTEDDGEALFRNIFANVRLQNRLIGRAELEVPKTFIPHRHTDENYMHFSLKLDAIAIEAIERVRLGGDIEFKLEILGEVVHLPNIMTGREDVIFRVNSASWISALKQMEYGAYLLCELPVDIKPSDTLQSAINNLDKAKKHLYLGHYDDAIGACRAALELVLPQEAELKHIKEEAKGKSRRDQSKQERLIMFLDSLRHLTSLAHHPDGEGNNTPFSRDEAIMVIGTTAAAISSAASTNKNNELTEAA